MARSHSVAATRKGRGGKKGGSSEGETSGVGSMDSAQLVERENKSNTRNRGPERAGSEAGSSTIPVMTMGSRATGRVSGG